MIENNRTGQIESVVTTMIELNIGSGVTSGILIGKNDFNSALNSTCVVIDCTRDKVDFKDKQIWISGEIDLSDVAAWDEPVLLRTVAAISMIWKGYAVYTEATSSDAGVTIGIGRNVASGAPTYWATATTEVSKAINDRTELTINRNGQLTATYYQPYFYSANNKTGAGKFKIVLEYVPGFPIYN